MAPNPLPASLEQECRKATKLFSAFADPVNGLDNVIPANVLRKAKGLALLTVVKAGFVFSARAGTGIVIARLPDGSWSAPSAIGTAGAGFGFQVGAEMAEFLIILNSRAAVASFMATGSLTLGGNLSVAAGPLGRNVEANGTLSSKGGLAAMYSYSRTKGLFGGASVEGSVIVERSDANSRSYGFNVTARQLLSGAVEVPEFADQLIETISRRSGNATNWSAADNDEGDPDGPRPDEGRGYAFGSQFAAGGTGSGSGSGKSGGGGIGSKIAGSIGRSRASSRASGGGGGPAISTSIKFDQDFGDDYSREQRANVSWGAGDDERQQRVRSATVGASSSKGRGAAADSAKLTKPRAGSVGVFGGARSKADAIAWRSPPSSSRSSEGYRGSRDSFDSLDDDDDERERRPAPRRFSNHHDLGSDDDLDNIGKSATPLRFPPSSIRSNSFANSSPFGDDAASPSPSRPSPSSKKSYSTKPWDSEDEDLMNFSSGKPRSGSTSYALSSSSPPRVISSHLVNKGDPFDFSQVDVDFASGSVGGRDGYANAAGMARSRSRASTVGKGLGSAVALFEFSSTEPGDLSFKKGDVITVLKQEDAEWWTGRIAIREGLFPRNYVDFIPY